MNLKTVVPLSAAAVLGLVAAIVAAQLVKQRPVIIQEGDQSRALNMSEVVVAARDLAPGTILGPADLTTARFEATGTPPGSFKATSLLVNRVVIQQMPRGQAFHPSMLAEKGVAGGLAAIIPDGMRAITIEVNEFTGVAGLMEPGNRVDILARIKNGNDAEKTQTRTVVQDVQILAIGQVLTNTKAVSEPMPDAATAAQKAQAESTLPASKQPGARSVTLLLSPEDAERIDLAMGENPTMAMRLALRAPNDRKPTETAGATLASLMKGSRADVLDDDAKLAGAKLGPTTRRSSGGVDDAFDTKVTARPAGRTVTIIRAGVASTVEVEGPAAE